MRPRPSKLQGSIYPFNPNRVLESAKMESRVAYRQDATAAPCWSALLSHEPPTYFSERLLDIAGGPTAAKAPSITAEGPVVLSDGPTDVAERPIDATEGPSAMS